MSRFSDGALSYDKRVITCAWGFGVNEVVLYVVEE